MDIAATNGVMRALHEGPFPLTNPILEVGRNLGIEPAGQPPPNAPELYIAVDENGVTVHGTPTDHGNHLEEDYLISVTISRRLGAIPRDRRQQAYQLTRRSLSPVEQQIKQAIHAKQEVRIFANEFADSMDNHTGQFQTPLFFRGRSPTEFKSAMEWSGEVGNDDSGWAVRRLNFVGLRFVVPSDKIYIA